MSNRAISQGSGSLYAVPVVRAVVADERGRVLILRRPPTDIGGGRWCLPGGKVEHGEPILDALRCELREETGLECFEARFLFYADSLPTPQGNMHCVNLVFECLARGDVKLNHEATDHCWIGPGDLDSYEFAFDHDDALRRFWQESARGRGT